MTEKLTMHTRDIVQDNVERIAQIFPNCVTETIDSTGKTMRAIDFEALKRQLSNEIINEGKERYIFTWPGKSEAQHLANTQINLTLRPSRNDSINFDNTKNIYIEGDNLDALKLLRETYLGKVKLIYIDPPYNTGHDFVYNDNYSQKLDEYNKNSGDFDKSGNMLFQNTTSNGRFHSDWLSMIYPRLQIAKDLLCEEGSIFISINDCEYDNLKKIGDEIFGSNNYLATFIRTLTGGKQDSKTYAIHHEYVLAYSKNCTKYAAGRVLKADGSYPYYDPEKKLHYKTQLLRKWGDNSLRSDRPNLFYPIVDPDGAPHYPMINGNVEGRWRWSQETMELNIKAGNVEFKKNRDEWIAYEKIYEPSEDEVRTKPFSTIISDIDDSTGASLISSIFGKKVFDYPKPVDLIKRILNMANVNGQDIVMDFFSGSATTAQAVLEYNRDNSTAIRFILVQYPEKILNDDDNSVFKNICNIGEERIRRVGQSLLRGQESSNATPIDYGFRVLCVSSSNMNDIYYNPQALRKDLLDYSADNIKADRSKEDLLFQVMLELGIDLSAPITTKTVSGKEVFIVDNGYLIACFDNDITDDIVTEIAKCKPVMAAFRDSSMINDSVAINFEQIFKAYSPNTKTKVL